MPTLEAQTGLTSTDEQRFYELMLTAQIAAEEHHLQPIGSYSSNAQTDELLPPAHHFVHHRPSTEAPVIPGPEQPAVPQHAAYLPAAVGRAVVTTGNIPITESGDPYFGTKRPQRFDDVPPGPPLELSGSWKLPVNHRLSNRRPSSYESRHRGQERSRLVRSTGRFLGYLAAVGTATAGALFYNVGTAY